MIKRFVIAIVAATSLMLAGSACKKTNFIDGGVSDPYVHMNTYAFLKQNATLDSAAFLIERAGLRDTLETGDVTFFAPPNRSISKYVKSKITATPTFNFDSLPAAEAYRLISKYIVRGHYNRDRMSLNGDFVSCFDTTLTAVRLVEVNAPGGYTTDKVQYVYYVKVKGTTIDPAILPVNYPAAEVDTKVQCQTSGLISNNGIIHVLTNGHTFGF